MNRKELKKEVKTATENAATQAATDVEALEKQMRSLNRSVKRVINATPDTYRTVDFNGVPCIHYSITVAGETIGLYAPESKLCTTEEFSPFNELRKEETRVLCNYMGSSICRISIDSKSKRMGIRASTSILSKEDGDSLIEAVSGVYGKQVPVPFSNVSVPANSIQTENILRLMMKSVNAVSCENRGVNAVLDNIAAHLDSWIFLVSQCNAENITEQKVPDYPDFSMDREVKILLNRQDRKALKNSPDAPAESENQCSLALSKGKKAEISISKRL